jgi:hypothetical protein
MKKRLIKASVAVAVIAITLIGVHTWLIDGLDGLIWGSLFQEDTEYAAYYTDGGWRAVRIGMKEADVKATIGAPLQVWTNQDASVGMRWSRSPGDTHFRCRVLQFGDGKVTGKHAEFYVD